jgi:preprotein translocase subunit SecG
VDIILLVLHVVLALGIISLVLLQKGAGANAGAVLGGGGAGSVFGASGSSNFLSKTTAVLATAFFINSLVLAYMASNRAGPETVVDEIEQVQMSTEPAMKELEQDSDVPVPLPFNEPVESDVPPPAVEDAAADSDVPPPVSEDTLDSDMPPPASKTE